MQEGNSRTDTRTQGRRRRFRPQIQPLEARIALAIDLANIAGGTGSAGPFGVLEAGFAQSGGAGFSVAEVGDVNGDGFDDFLIGAPGLNPNFGDPTLGTGPGTAYLVLGSNQVGNTNFNWLNLTSQERVGDLNVLGNTNQTNPLNGQPGFNFNGLTFIASQNLNGQLGASVRGVGDINGDGLADFMIGAPGATDANGVNNGTGRAYLVYGSTALGSRTNKTVDFDNTLGGNSDLNILTFTNLGQANSRTGFAFAGIGDFLTDGTNDIAIGAPNATVSGLASQGAVYVINGSVLRPARTGTIALNTVGQSGGPTGLVFTGDLSGDAAGFSVAGPGNTTGAATSARQPIFDLLIGAPDTSVTGALVGNGSAYLVLGDTLPTMLSYATTVNGVTFIDLGDIGNRVPGIPYVGPEFGARTGWSVATAGDFNADGLADYLIGSPGTSAGTGLATMVFGTATIPTPTAPGFNVASLPSTLPFVNFTGISPGSLAGFSLDAVGRINNDSINEIVIGSPGVNGGQGQVYLIPGNPDLFGTFSLAATETLPVQGLIITLSQPSTSNFLGVAVGGRLSPTGAGRTADSDSIGDFIIGAPGFALPGTTRDLAGGGFMLQGAFIPLPDVVPTFIPMGIAGIDGDFTSPFDVNATTPAAMQIFVLSNAGIQPPFAPATDLDPTSIVVNGVAYPNATIVADTVDRNNDGIPDAIITISPRGNLNLRSSTRTLTVQGRTLASSPNPNRRVQGEASINVQGGGGGGGGGLANQRITLLELFNPNAAVPQFGERLVPSPTAIGRLNWRPALAGNIAIRQFLPELGFRGRLNEFYHGTKFWGEPLGSKKSDSQYGVTTLGQDVFTRSQFKREGLFDARTWIPRKGSWWYGRLGSHQSLG